jgi:hypothetical protein
MAKSDDEDLDRFINLLRGICIVLGLVTAFLFIYPLFS